MKRLNDLFQFLGSVYFAIILIASVLLFAAIGTALESFTDSHRYASLFTYNNPVFLTLLCCFFINILFSTLRRWPFNSRHIPFIITHCGLLMIITGVFIKSFWGLQGNMILLEGSGSETVFLPQSYELAIERKEPFTKSAIPFTWSDKSIKTDHFPELSIEIEHLAPHANERLETWIKKDLAFIFGIPPIPVQLWKNGEPLPISANLDVPLFSKGGTVEIAAIRTSDVAEFIQQYYVDSTSIRISSTSNGELLYESSLDKFIKQKLYNIDLTLGFSPIVGIKEPFLKVEGNHFSLRLALDEESTLFNQNMLTPYLGKAPITIDLSRKPALLLVQDLQGDTYFFGMDAHGRIAANPFRQDNLTSFIAYDKGFGGYTIQNKVKQAPSRGDIETAYREHISTSIDRGVSHQNNMATPLKLFSKSCDSSKNNFAQCLVQFLDLTSKGGSWILPEVTQLQESLSKVITNLNWNSIPQDRNGCFWICKVFKQLDPLLSKGDNIRKVLQNIGWPLQIDKDETSDFDLLTNISEQIFSIGRELTVEDSDLSEFSNAQLFSAYLRAHEIHLSPFFASSVLTHDEITLECPLTTRHTLRPANTKIEDNFPLAVIKIKKNAEKERISLLFDPFAETLKQPILNGEYLIRFQPHFYHIPVHLRLRQARRINYANAEQPFSYECDLIITDLSDNTTVEKTLSMNHVHETKGGYRFYLSNIHPTDESAVKQVQLAVNYDPAKYWLTYPGALLLTLGVFLLFWKRK